jgi:hypothetical protein
MQELIHEERGSQGRDGRGRSNIEQETPSRVSQQHSYMVALSS